MAFLFGHGETFIMAFCLSGANFSGREEAIMKTEARQSFTPVPWDNLPRQPEPKFHPPSGPHQRGVPRGTVDTAFSSGQVFHPFQATSAIPEEEK